MPVYWWRSLFIVALGALLLWALPVLQSSVRPILIAKNVYPISRDIQQRGIDGSVEAIVYDRLGIAAPLIRQLEANPFAYADWSSLRTALRKGVSITVSPFEGDKNTYYVIGHSSDVVPHQYSAVFASLKQASVHDTFKLTIDGQDIEYSVVESKVISPTDTRAFASLSNTDPQKERVVLVTCWPLFTTQDRLVVVGERSLAHSI